MTAPAIDARDVAWTAACPRPTRTHLAVATPITLHGYRRRVQPHECRWLHGALTAVLGRGHAIAPRIGQHTRPDWTLVPTGEAPSGWGAVWWSPEDGLALAGGRWTARIGRVPVELELGRRLSLRMPPRYAAGAHVVRLHARAPVCSRRNLFRDDPKRRRTEWRREPTSEALRGMLETLADKAGVDPGPVRVALVRAATKARGVRLGGKLGTRVGWLGSCDLVANAPARWLLECASRGLGLGHSVAYGLGRVEVRPW